MQHEINKITRIVDELTTYLLSHGAIDLGVRVKREEQQVLLQFTDYHCHFSNDTIEAIRYELETNRQHEVEGYYWQLAGEDEDGEELTLVGSMVDESSVSLKDQILTIELTRKCL